MTALAPTPQAFLTSWLMTQRGASPNTVASYRDTFRLLLWFAAELTRKPVPHSWTGSTRLLIAAFLEHLEVVRHNSIRNATTVCQRSTRCSGYAAASATLSMLATIQRLSPDDPDSRWSTARSSPSSLTTRSMPCSAPAPQHLGYQRDDQALFDLAVEAGPSISEAGLLKYSDVTLGRGANLHVTGKGRKERLIPLGHGAGSAVSEPGCSRQAAIPLVRPPHDHRHPFEPRAAIEHRCAHPSQQRPQAVPSIQRKPVTTHSPLRHTLRPCAPPGQRSPHRGHRPDPRPRGHRHYLRLLPSRRPASSGAGFLRRSSLP